MIKEYTNIPLHVIEEITKMGYGRQLCLYASLKQVYNNGEIYNYKSIPKNLGFKISRKTYVKYIIQLKNILGLIRGELKNGKAVMRCITQKELLKKFPAKKPIFIKFKNNSDLQKKYEKLIIERNLYNQRKKKQIRLRKTENIEIVKIIKTVREKRFVENTNIEHDLSISCQGTAKLLGKKSKATGSNRQIQWENIGFINIVKRKINLGKLSKDMFNFRKRSIAEGGLQQNIYRIPFNNVCYQSLANEIEIRNSIFKQQAKYS